MANFQRGSVTFDQALDFTRGSEATYFDSSGVLQTAAVNEPRFDHDPVTGEPLGLLIEEQRTNQWLFPEDLSADTFFEAGTEATPDGGTGYKHVPGDGVGKSQKPYPNGSFVAGQSYTYSIFLKSDGLSRFSFVSNNANIIDPIGTFDIVAMTAPPGGIIEPAPNGYVRVSRTVVAAISGNTSQLVRIDEPGDGISGMYMYGGQIEQGAFATSYIPIVSGTQVTRAADICSRTLGAEFNVSEGAFSVTAAAPIGETVVQAGSFSIVSDSDTEKTYTAGYTADPSATTLDIAPGASVATIKSLTYTPRSGA